MEKFKKILYISWFFYTFFINLFVLKAEYNSNQALEKIGQSERIFQKNFNDSIESAIDAGDIIKLEHSISSIKISESDFRKYLLMSKDNILKKRENLNKKITAVEIGQLTGGILSIFLASIGISSFCYLAWGYFIDGDLKDNNYYKKEYIDIIKSAIYGLPPAVIILGLFGDRLLTKFFYKKNREKQYNNSLGIDYVLYSKFNNKFKNIRELDEKK